MVGEALQLQGHAPHQVRAGRHLARPPGPRAAGSRRWRGRWWCRPQAVSVLRLSGWGPPSRAFSTPAMLVAQGDLQVEDVLAVALEAEVAGLDDARVDRPHGHLVDLLALDAVEVAHAGGPALRSRCQASGAPCPGQVEAHRLEPGMALGDARRTARRSPARRGGPAGSRGVSDGKRVAVQLRAQDAEQAFPASSASTAHELARSKSAHRQRAGDPPLLACAAGWPRGSRGWAAPAPPAGAGTGHCGGRGSSALMAVPPGGRREALGRCGVRSTEVAACSSMAWSGGGM